ncbi:MAG: DUF4433 domain-containing protein [Krumholzibacteria bacterium]|nr:DUF4433 domain-containing protein [Candidatus Krumholzibacteria bacterium]
MEQAIPVQPKLYHIVHVDKLPAIVTAGCLKCDADMVRGDAAGTTIGLDRIKQRRLTRLRLTSHPDLRVGDCVPFYFCPRSVMLYLIHRGNDPDLTYRGGQEPIVHLECDLAAVVAWADSVGRRWAFTLSNAGATYFEDRRDLARLHEIDWQAVQARQWSGRGVAPSVKEGKQAEFLVERDLPWTLIERIGLLSTSTARLTAEAIAGAAHLPPIAVLPEWYY